MILRLKVLYLSLTILSIIKIFAQQDDEVTKVFFKESFSFFRLQFEFGGKQKVEIIDTNKIFSARSQLGFSIGLISATQSDFQIETRVGYRKVDLGNILQNKSRHLELYIGLGGRYLPRNPITTVYGVPIRFTFALLGLLNLRGYEIADQVDFDLIADVGMFFSQKDNLSGFLLEFQYRPLGSNAIQELFLRPSWAIACSFMFGPENRRYYQSQ